MGTSTAEIGIRVFMDDAASKIAYGINQQLGQMENLTRRAGLGFRGMTGDITGLSIVAGLIASFLLFGGAIVYSTDQAAKLQTTMIGLKAATGATDAQVQQMQNTLLTLGATSIFSLDELAQGFTLAGQRGVSAGDIIKYVGQQGIFLAEAIGVKPVAAFGLLASVLAAFNLPASQAGKVADLLFFAFEHGVPSVSQLTAGLGKLGSVAAILHVPLDQIIPAFDVVARAMGSGTVAATGLYFFLKQISAGTPAFRTEIAKLGLSFYDLNGKFIGLIPSLDELYKRLKSSTPHEAAIILQALFAQRSSQSLAILLQDLSKFDTLVKQLKTSHDAYHTALAQAKKAEDSLAGSTAALKTNLTDFAALAGGPLSTALTPVVQNINKFVSTLRDMAANNPKAFSSIMLIGAALAGLGLVVAIALSPFAILIGIMVGVVAVVAGLAAGITWLADNWSKVVAAVHPVIVIFQQLASFLGGIFGPVFHEVMGGFGSDGAILSQLVAIITGTFRPAWLGMVDAFKTAMPAIKAVGMILGALLGGVLLGLVALVTSVVVGIVHGLAFLITGIVMIATGIIVALMGVIRFILGFVQLFQALFLLLTGHSQAASVMVQSAFRNMIGGLISMFQGMFTAILGILTATVGTILAFIGGFVSGIVAWFHKLAAMLIGHSIIPDMLTAILTAFVTFFANIISGIAAWVAHIISVIINFATAMLVHIRAVITMIRVIWQNGWNALIALIVAFVVGVIVHILVLKAQAQAKFNEVMTSIHTAITTGISKAVQFFKDLPGKIISALSILGTMLFNAGKSALQRFLDGINSIIQNIKNAIGGIVQWISDHLPRSPAKMGPLKDLDKTGPAFINEIAKGIESGAPRLELALNRATGGMSSIPVRAGGGYGGGTATYNLILEGRVLGSWTVNYITGHLQMNGMGRMLR